MTLSELILPAVTLAALAVFYARSSYGKNVLAARAAAALDPTDLRDGQEGRLTGTIEEDGQAIAAPLSGQPVVAVIATARHPVGDTHTVAAREDLRRPFLLNVQGRRVRIDPAQAEISAKLEVCGSTSVFDGANPAERALLARHAAPERDSMGLLIVYNFDEQGLRVGRRITAAGQIRLGPDGPALVAPASGPLRLIDADA